MSGSSVMPAGSKRRLVNVSTKARSGTPYCRPWLTEIANESMMPASVEPCFDTLRNSSPGRPSSYSATVAKDNLEPLRQGDAGYRGDSLERAPCDVPRARVAEEGELRSVAQPATGATGRSLGDQLVEVPRRDPRHDISSVVTTRGVHRGQ